MSEHIKNIPGTTSEQSPSLYLSYLKNALDLKNRELLRAVVNGIQTYVHGIDKTHYSPLSENDIDALLETGSGVITVGTGTHGECIYIKDGELYMAGSPQVDPFIRDKKENFRRLFNLSPGTKDLRVRFNQSQKS